MKISRKNLLFIATLLFLAIPLVFSGNAGAAYRGDGATHNATTGLWEGPANTATCFGNTSADATGTAPHSIDISTVPAGSKCNSLQPAWFATTYPDSPSCTGAGLSWSSSSGCRNAYTDSTDPAYVAARAAYDCLYCHSGGHGSNRTGYLKGGHKNMARKLDGSKWAGSIEYGSKAYTGYNWNNPGTTAAGTSYMGTTTTGTPVFWIYDGWLASSPRAASPGGSYNCGRCHTTGWTADATPQATKEPIATFGSTIGTDINLSAADDSGTVQPNSSWDYFGILCSRCHNAVTGHANTGDPANNMKFAGTSHGVTTSVAEAGASQVAICLNCHRAVDSKNLPLDAATRNIGTELKVANSHGALGLTSHDNGYLNSPHAKFSGTYGQLSDSTKYNSHFVTNDGTCAGCHNLHDSVTDTAPGGEPFENECGISCHGSGSYAKLLVNIQHPAGPGTPFEGITDMTVQSQEPCAVCHMPGGIHLFRISADPNYTTFAAAGSNVPTVANSSGYPEAFVDLDMACGQCHGGSKGATAVANGAPYISKGDLAPYAAVMHGAAAGSRPPVVANTITAAGGTFATGVVITLADNSTDPVTAQTSLNVVIDWGDGSQSVGKGKGSFTHTYSIAGPTTIIETVTNDAGLSASLYTFETISVVAPTTSISGHVYNCVSATSCTTNPAEGVKVKLKNAAGYVKQVTTTDSNGLYTFANVASGTYTVIAKNVGTEFSYTSASVTSPGTADLNLNKATIAISSNAAFTKVTATGSKTIKKWTSTIGSGPYVAKFKNLSAGTWGLSAAVTVSGTTTVNTCSVLPNSIDLTTATLDLSGTTPTVTATVTCP